MLKKSIASLVIGGAVLGGAASAGAAYAATPSAGTATAGTASAGTVSSGTTSQATSLPIRIWLQANRKEIRKAGIAISAKTIGITPTGLVSELRSGKSVAGVAAEHNVSAQTVIDAVVAAADAKVNQGVAAHKLTSAEANKIESMLPARVAKVVHHTF